MRNPNALQIIISHDNAEIVNCQSKILKNLAWEN